jgi:carboxyl-terminal processing protease
MLKASQAPRERRAARALCLLAAVCALGCAALPARAQSLSLDRDRSRAMLRTIKEDLKKNYYDPTFRGMNLDERFAQAEEKLKTAADRGQMFGIIAQILIELDDSHTYFYPPGRTSRVDYGWRMQMVGDNCYVSAVRPGSDAEAKGLKVGDLVVEVGGYGVTRDNLWKIEYLYNLLKPQPGLRAVVQSPGGQPRQLDLMAKVTQGKLLTDLTDGNEIFKIIREMENEEHYRRHRYVEAEGVMIWKMPQFDLSKEKVDDMMGKARKHPALILDLRGNGGGYEETMLRMVANLFKQDVTIGELKRRKETKPLVAKSRGADAYDGKLVVLIDSESGSAAELLARVVQLEKRGTVIGDRSSGAVMRSRDHPHQLGADIVVFYAASITDADIVMADGKSLEKVGVTPDELRLPTAEDLAAKRDPVLAYAASLVGVKLDPVKAGALFPVEWRKN